MLIILFAGPRTWVARGLSLGPMVGIGLISYSAYLWHQPLFAFARILSPVPPSFGVMMGLAVASLGLAWLSWRYVEQPFRDTTRPLLPRRSGAFAASLAGIAAFAVFGFTGVATDGFKYRLDRLMTPELRRLTDAFDQDWHHADCFAGSDAPTRWSELCEIATVTAPRHTFGLIGDSHALALMPAMRSLSERFDARILAAAVPACPPLVGIVAAKSAGGSAHCQRAVEAQIDGLREAGADMVFLVARWSLYATDGYDTREPGYALALDGQAIDSDPQVALAVMRTALSRTISRFTVAGIRVVLVQQVPAQKLVPRQVVERLVLLRTDADTLDARIEDSFVEAAAHEALQERANGVLRAMENDMVRVVSLQEAFAMRDRFAWYSNDEVLYADRDHLSPAGASRAGRYLAQRLESAFGSP